MKLIKKLGEKLRREKNSSSEHKEFAEVCSEETKKLRKRPQFIVGVVLLGGLMFYFLIRASIPEKFVWPSLANVVGVVSGAGGGVFVGWLILKILGVKGLFAKIFLPVMFLWFVFFGLMVWSQPDSQLHWEYLIYSVVTLAGWLLCYEAIKRHFCERILASPKDKKEEKTGEDV